MRETPCSKITKSDPPLYLGSSAPKSTHLFPLLSVPQAGAAQDPYGSAPGFLKTVQAGVFESLRVFLAAVNFHHLHIGLI